MPNAKLTISIDLELGWGNWDNITPFHIHNIESKEHLIIERLLEIFDRYGITVTWAFVAALLDEDSARSMPGSKSLWYAPEIIDKIRKSNMPHDLGSHGGKHKYFDSMSKNEAIEDIQFAAYIHSKNGMPLNSFVYPRNKVGRIDLIAEQGIKVYRGQDLAWHQTIRNKQALLGRAANLLDKLLPISPQAVSPELKKDICNIPGSMLFFSRNGIRKLAHPKITLNKLHKGILNAINNDGVFHLWFHPSNFWTNTDQQFEIFETFIKQASTYIENDQLEVSSMAGFSPNEH